MVPFLRVRFLLKATLQSVVLVVAVIAFGLGLLWLRDIRSANVGSFGDGSLTDSGFFSYPRYRVSFPVLQIVSGSSHVLTVSNLPPVRLTLGLELLATNEDQIPQTPFAQTEWNGTTLRVSVERLGVGTLSEAHVPIRDWVLAQSELRQMLWHANLRDLRFAQKPIYHVTIELLNAPQDLPPLVVRPILEGGGNELP